MDRLCVADVTVQDDFRTASPFDAVKLILASSWIACLVLSKASSDVWTRNGCSVRRISMTNVKHVCHWCITCHIMYRDLADLFDLWLSSSQQRNVLNVCGIDCLIS